VGKHDLTSEIKFPLTHDDNERGEGKKREGDLETRTLSKQNVIAAAPYSTEGKKEKREKGKRGGKERGFKGRAYQEEGKRSALLL